MQIFLKIIGTLLILLGVFVVFGGIMATTDNGISSFGIVFGGGLFMALGVAIFALNKN